MSSISSSTAAASAAGTTYVYECTTALTVTLPTAIGNTSLYVIKRTGSGTVTVATTSSQTIDGASTVSLNTAYQVTWLVSNGTNWLTI